MIALSRERTVIDARATFGPAACGNVLGPRIDDPIRFVFVRGRDIGACDGKRRSERCGNGMPSTGKAGCDSHDVSPVCR
ncbi:hypothetical protein [Burkholderia pseudomallei]|uniref:hypothetical protein n=1 Tax=Burkholderia pseudomallei TaxID=28450 RepID=UPI001AAE9369|nr:hypothetical protein [Burkholderia pseudomallei]MBO2986029.1 hypothetical protein [Burkholderia pseudomallei]MBO7780329.1 hypothetical protein [Burkholderia pseudomallei]MBO7918382.1 hypothetical protein [Burkholderia pseudomallei]